MDRTFTPGQKDSFSHFLGRLFKKKQHDHSKRKSKHLQKFNKIRKLNSTQNEGTEFSNMGIKISKILPHTLFHGHIHPFPFEKLPPEIKFLVRLLSCLPNRFPF
jgi:hypothetical protein